MQVHDANYTPEQLQYFKAEYSRRRKRRVWLGIGSFAFVGATVLLWLVLVPKWLVAVVCALVLIVVFSFIVVLNLVIWTCPACKKPLGREWNYNYCPNCGIELQDTISKST